MKILIYGINYAPELTGIGKYSGEMAQWLAAAGHEAGFLLTPGSLFSPNQSPSTWMRFNVANCGDPALPAFLNRYLESVVRRAS